MTLLLIVFVLWYCCISLAFTYFVGFVLVCIRCILVVHAYCLCIEVALHSCCTRSAILFVLQYDCIRFVRVMNSLCDCVAFVLSSYEMNLDLLLRSSCVSLAFAF